MTIISDPTNLQPQESIAYRTFLRGAMVEALRGVFVNHPDPAFKSIYDGAGNLIRGTNVTLEYPTDEKFYPAIVVSYRERNVYNAGVGHIENIFDPTTSGVYPFRHSYYKGTISFNIVALTSLDLDLLSDSIVQIMRMPDMATYTNQYFQQIYNTEDPTPNLHYINIDTDKVQGGNEMAANQPWLSENQLQYSMTVSTDVFGEFYSRPPDFTFSGYITKATAYPYIQGIDPVPSGANDPAPWIDQT